jgi:hypothetical protein
MSKISAETWDEKSEGSGSDNVGDVPLTVFNTVFNELNTWWFIVHCYLRLSTVYLNGDTLMLLFRDIYQRRTIDNGQHNVF